MHSTCADLYILSMPTISSEAFDVLDVATVAPPLGLMGDSFRGDEKMPVISSSPFSSTRPCGRVTPVRLHHDQRIF
jgi:hypothetical protein